MSARRCCPMRPDACGFEPRRDDHLAIGDRTTGKPRRQRDGPVAAWKDTHLDFGAAGSIPARPAIVRGTGGMPTRGGYRTCRSCSTAARVNRAVEGAEWLPYISAASFARSNPRVRRGKPRAPAYLSRPGTRLPPFGDPDLLRTALSLRRMPGPSPFKWQGESSIFLHGTLSPAAAPHTARRRRRKREG